MWSFEAGSAAVAVKLGTVMHQLTVWRRTTSPTVTWGHCTAAERLPACRRPLPVAFISSTIITIINSSISSMRPWASTVLLAHITTTASRRRVSIRRVPVAMATRRPVAVSTRPPLTRRTRTRRGAVVEPSRCWPPRTPIRRRTASPTNDRPTTPPSPRPNAPWPPSDFSWRHPTNFRLRLTSSLSVARLNWLWREWRARFQRLFLLSPHRINVRIGGGVQKCGKLKSGFQSTDILTTVILLRCVAELLTGIRTKMHTWRVIIRQSPR